jgi:hypothetical protein
MGREFNDGRATGASRTAKHHPADLIRETQSKRHFVQGSIASNVEELDSTGCLYEQQHCEDCDPRSFPVAITTCSASRKNRTSFQHYYAKAMPGTNYLPDSPTLRTPASKRISLPVSQRLSTVTEGTVAQAPTSARWSARASTSTAATHRTAPPPYQLLPPPVRHDIPNSNDEEKLGRLRRKVSATERRGGWGRLALLLAALLGVIGLAVGLGVGLTKGRKKDSDGTGEDDTTYTQQQQPDNSTPTQQLPLGQYSFVTSLRSQQTNCTSNPATWRCYPYTTLDPSNPSTNTTSQSTFSWIISNTSAIYATARDAPSTPSSGIPANLTLSSTNNPFALTFTNQTLTYQSSSSDDGNTSSPPMLTFAFTLPKTVVPTSAIASDNSATQCFFNSTVLSGRIYLAAAASSSSSSSSSSPEGLSSDSAADAGSLEQWPYGVEVLQSSAGGEGTPDCYKTVNGGLGERVTTEGLEPVTARGEECRCVYSNL